MTDKNKNYLLDADGKRITVCCRVCGRGFQVYRPLSAFEGSVHEHIEDRHSAEACGFSQEFRLIGESVTVAIGADRYARLVTAGVDL